MNFKKGNKVKIQPFAFDIYEGTLHYGKAEKRRPYKIEKKDVFIIVEGCYSFIIKRLSDGQLFDCIGWHDLDKYSISNRIFRLFFKYPYSLKSLINNFYINFYYAKK